MPFGGDRLLSARVAGKRPAEMVVFSLIGPLQIENSVIWAGAHQNIGTFDLKFLADLDVEVATDTQVPFARLLQAIRAVQAHANGVFVWWRDIEMTITIRWVKEGSKVMLPQLQDASDPKVRQLARDVYKRLAKEFDK